MYHVTDLKAVHRYEFKVDFTSAKGSSVPLGPNGLPDGYTAVTSVSGRESITVTPDKDFPLKGELGFGTPGGASGGQDLGPGAGQPAGPGGPAPGPGSGMPMPARVTCVIRNKSGELEALIARDFFFAADDGIMVSGKLVVEGLEEVEEQKEGGRDVSHPRVPGGIPPTAKPADTHASKPADFKTDFKK